MKKTSVILSMENNSPREAWKKWGAIVEERGLGAVLTLENSAPITEAHINCYAGDNACIQLLSRNTSGLTETRAETVIKSPREPKQPQYELRFLSQGCATIQQGERSLRLRKGETLFLRNTCDTKIQLAHGDYALSTFQIQSDPFLDGIASQIETQIIDEKKPWGKALATTLATSTEDLLDKIPISGLALFDSLRSLLSLNLQRGKETTDISPRLLPELKRFIFDNLYDPLLSPETAVMHFGVSRRTIYNALHKEGLCFSSFVTQLRIRRAQMLLENKWLAEKSISEIAYMVGFSNASHFSSLFKRRIGLSPERFRSLQKENGA